MTRCSFVLMTRDRANFLPGAFAQLREQKGKDDEVVVTGYLPDDATYLGVKDNKAIVDKLLHVRADSGAEAVNAAKGLLEGEYVRIVSDDDYTYADQMEHAIQVMARSTDIDLLVCGGVKKDVPSGKTSLVCLPKGTSYATSPKDILQWGACGTGFLFRRNVLDKVQFDTSVIADMTFAIDCINAGLTVKFCRIKMFRHPIYQHSNIHAKRNEMEKALRKLYIQYSFVLEPLVKNAPAWDGSLT